MVLLRGDRARRHQPLRDAPPRRSEAHLWRSPCRTRKRRRLFRNATAACRAGVAGRAGFPGRPSIYHCRHAADHLPDLGGELPGAGYPGVSRLYGEAHRSAGLPCRHRGQQAEDGIVSSACRLLPRNTAAAREMAIQRQMSRAFRSGAAMDVDLLCHERLAALGAYHHWIEILAAEVVGVQQRPPLLPGHVDITPVDDRHDDRVEVEPFRCQAILMTHRPLLVGHFDEHKLVDQLFKATGKDRPSDAETLLEVLEAPDTQKAVP